MFQIWQSAEKDSFLCKAKLYVPDKSGSLARIANLFAQKYINITYFYYNRSEHPNRVLIEGKSSEQDYLVALKELLPKKEYFDEIFEEDLQITNLSNILKISVYIENKPGSLAKFADILRNYEANVIYMIYNELVSENKADIAFYVKSREQIRNLLQRMNEEGYHYSIEYSGTDMEYTNSIIGLNLVEKFFLKLGKLMSQQDIDELKKIVYASKHISDTLVNFNKEAGKNLEAGEVFANILTFAIFSTKKTKESFYYKRLPPLVFDDYILYCFRLPTGGNVYIFKLSDSYVMIDGSYGIYYEDVKRMLRVNGIEPGKIRKIFISHADADHAGMSGYFEEEFGTEVFMHSSCRGIIENQNRAFGATTILEELNRNFTILVNTFTKCKFPVQWKPFKEEVIESINGFSVIDRFFIGELEFKVLESLGGHIPGQVFFYVRNRDYFLQLTIYFMLRVWGKRRRVFSIYPSI